MAREGGREEVVEAPGLAAVAEEEDLTDWERGRGMLVVGMDADAERALGRVFDRDEPASISNRSILVLDVERDAMEWT